MRKTSKEKILNAIASHPKAVTLGVGLAIAAGLALAVDFTHLALMAFASTTCASCKHIFTPGSLFFLQTHVHL